MATYSNTQEFDKHIRTKTGIKCQFIDDIINLQISIPDKAQSITFECCTFNKKVFLFGNYNTTVTFKKCIFNKGVSLDYAVFNENVRIQHCAFREGATFVNTVFENLCDFFKTTFYQKVIFYKTDFKGTTVFSTTKFLDNVLFTYTLIEKMAIFRDTTIKKGFDISTALITGHLNLFGFELGEYISIPDPIEEQEYEDAISEDGDIPDKNKRETYRVLKMQLEANKDHFNALEFKALEKKTYASELKPKWIRSILLNIREGLHNKLSLIYNKYGFIKWINKHIVQPIIKFQLGNTIILFFSYVSNNYGRSWFRGVLFTMGFGWLFFYLLLITSNSYEPALNLLSWEEMTNKDLGKLYLTFLTPTHKPDFFDGKIDETLCTYLFDFLGRIFIAYGIYQTVQAFRKYRS